MLILRMKYVLVAAIRWTQYLRRVKKEAIGE